VRVAKLGIETVAKGARKMTMSPRSVGTNSTIRHGAVFGLIAGLCATMSLLASIRR
jgi:hypothetical protein